MKRMRKVVILVMSLVAVGVTIMYLTVYADMKALCDQRVSIIQTATTAEQSG